MKEAREGGSPSCWRRRVGVLVAAGSTLVAVGADAQEPRSVPLEGCEIPRELLAPNGLNIYSPQQEMHLGDAIAEHLEANFRVIDEQNITAELQRLGDSIVAQLPDTGIEFRFTLVDTPTPTAFALAGGHIYVSRKLIGMSESEDELAGVLAHEVAHVASRHQAVSMTEALRHYLDVTELAGRSDVREKYHEYIEAARRAPRRLDRGDLHDKQVQADLVGLYAAAKAGYDPTAFASILDRLTGAEGKKGNWFSDLMGTTRPGSKRLRETDREMRNFSQECGTLEGPRSKEDFEAFQSLAMANTGLDRQESLEGLLTKRALDEPLPAMLRQLRFSPDSSHLLAQDDRNIYVYSREPLELSFYIQAPEATSAHFTPDSRSLVWLDRELRLESWSLAGKQLEDARELVVREGCLQPRLSPDGRLLVCFSYEGDLFLHDVLADSELFRKRRFYSLGTARGNMQTRRFRARISLLGRLNRGTPGWLFTGFSPDGRYFAAAQPPSWTVAVDLAAGKEISLPGSIKNVLLGGFTFLEHGRVAGLDRKKPESSGVFAFPSGDTVAQMRLGRQTLSAPGRGNYLLVRPVPDRPLGVIDIEANKLILTSAEPAFDIYDDVFVNQRRAGEIRLYRLAAVRPDGGVDVDVLATATLPLSGLGRLEAAAVSSNLDLLAFSGRDRGGIWRLATGERLLRSRGFRGSFFQDATLYADFPGTRDADRRVIALTPNGPEEGPALEAPHLRQIGDVLLGAAASDDGAVLEARRVSDLEQLWSRDLSLTSRLAHMLRWFATPKSLALVWPGDAKAAKKIVDNDERMKERYRALDDTELVPVVEVVDTRTGETRGGVLLHHVASSAQLSGVQVHGDTVVASLKDNRVLVYSLSSGELAGRLFGREPVVNTSGRFLSVANHAGDLVLYGLPSLDELRRYRFSAPVTVVHMDDVGRRLFVLTNQQTAYSLEIPSP